MERNWQIECRFENARICLNADYEVPRVGTPSEAVSAGIVLCDAGYLGHIIDDLNKDIGVVESLRKWKPERCWPATIRESMEALAKTNAESYVERAQWNCEPSGRHAEAMRRFSAKVSSADAEPPTGSLLAT